MQSLEFLHLWREQARKWQSELPAPDQLPTGAMVKAALLAGEPLITLVQPVIEPERFAAVLTDLAALYAEGQPSAAPLAQALTQAPAVERNQLAVALLAGDDPEAWVARRGLLTDEPGGVGTLTIAPTDLLLTLAGLALQPFLSRFALALTDGSAVENWRKNECPVCGSRPDLCRIDPDNHRYLHCPQCDTQWEHHRLTCGVCDTDDVKKVNILSVAEMEPWRVEVCDVCGGYMKTLDQRHGGHLAMPRVDLYLEDARTLQLDLLAEQEGYRRGGRTQ